MVRFACKVRAVAVHWAQHGEIVEVWVERRQSIELALAHGHRHALACNVLVHGAKRRIGSEAGDECVAGVSVGMSVDMSVSVSVGVHMLLGREL